MTGGSLQVFDALEEDVDLKHHNNRVNTLGGIVVTSQTSDSEVTGSNPTRTTIE